MSVKAFNSLFRLAQPEQRDAEHTLPTQKPVACQPMAVRVVVKKARLLNKCQVDGKHASVRVLDLRSHMQRHKDVDTRGVNSDQPTGSRVS